MSNILRLAPYAYLAKRSGGGSVYDLLLLVPVDSSGDTDLSNLTAVKPPRETRVTIDYTTTNSAANVPYRFKHFVIDSDNGAYVDIKIRGDNNDGLSNIIAFADADTEPATVSNQQQTCAPYLFAKIETAGNVKFVHPSCVVLFDTGIGMQSESIVFAPHSCTPTLALGNSNATTDPTLFAINLDIKALLTINQVYTFEVNVSGNTNLGKPPRKNKVKVLWT